MKWENLTIATPNQPLVEVSSLVGIDEVKSSLGAASGDLVVSFPYKEGEIEKISYTKDNKFLNIIVKAGEKGLSFTEDDVLFTRGGRAPELLFVIGSPRISDLGSLYDIEFLKDTLVVNIDNKAENQGFGDIKIVSSRLSSVSEAVCSLIFSLGLKMDLDIAQNLMLGIATATNNFTNDNTSPLAFEMAGLLLRQGAIRPSFQPVVNQKKQVRRQSLSFEEKEEKPLEDIEVEEKTESTQKTNPPEDWLEPKIYKGSTNF
jgi:hypothetical protein